MKTDVLKSFMDVAHAKSISKAAKKQNIPQQTLSKNMKSLENELGVTLLARTKQGVNLTAAGEEVYRFAKWCLQEYAEMNLDLEQQPLLKDDQTSIKIAGMETAIQHVGSKVMAQMYLKYPTVLMEIEQMKQNDVLTKVRNGEYDLGLLMQYRNDQLVQPMIDEDLQFFPIYQSKSYVWINPASALAEKKQLTYSLIGQQKLLLLKNNDDELMQTVWEQNKVSKREMIICDNIHYAIQLLIHNVGVIMDLKNDGGLNLEHILDEIGVPRPIHTEHHDEMITGVLIRKDRLQEPILGQMIQEFLKYQTIPVEESGLK